MRNTLDAPKAVQKLSGNYVMQLEASVQITREPALSQPSQGRSKSAKEKRRLKRKRM